LATSQTSGAYEHAFRVSLHDTDAAGTMFFGHLFRHAHDAYEAFMGTIGFPLDRIIRDGKTLLPLVHAEADYRMPLRHGERVRVRLTIDRIGRTSFTLSYRFLDAEDQVRAAARTVHVHLIPDRQSAAPLPHALKASLKIRFSDPEGV
jgi:1,4-dihydroxy-2-naphthoyl-CoA hydrolase